MRFLSALMCGVVLGCASVVPPDGFFTLETQLASVVHEDVYSRRARFFLVRAEREWDSGNAQEGKRYLHRAKMEWVIHEEGRTLDALKDEVGPLRERAAQVESMMLSLQQDVDDLQAAVQKKRQWLEVANAIAVSMERAQEREAAVEAGLGRADREALQRYRQMQGHDQVATGRLLLHVVGVRGRRVGHREGGVQDAMDYHLSRAQSAMTTGRWVEMGEHLARVTALFMDSSVRNDGRDDDTRSLLEVVLEEVQRMTDIPVRATETGVVFRGGESGVDASVAEVVSRVLERFSGVDVVVMASGDSRKTRTDAREDARALARSAVDRLMSTGISRDRISTVVFANERPVPCMAGRQPVVAFVLVPVQEPNDVACEKPAQRY